MSSDNNGKSSVRFPQLRGRKSVAENRSWDKDQALIHEAVCVTNIVETKSSVKGNI